MKLTTAVFLGLGTWAAYELYKNHTYKATIAAMKTDMMGLKAKVAKLAAGDDKPSNSLSSGANAPVPNGTQAVVVGDGVTGVNNSAWGSFVGQPILTEIVVPNDPLGLKNYSGVSYDGIFRKKPVAFGQFAGLR